jgi:hypothetical protein
MNPEERSFTGLIDWSEANFKGDARWEYNIKFSEDSETIESGSIAKFDSNGDSTGQV